MTPKPTDAELAILNTLWEHGPCTVREVHEHLGDREVHYTTILKQLQVMYDKGLVKRDNSSRSHIYRAAVSQEKTQAALLDQFLDTIFGGSTSALVMRALSHRRSSEADLAEIRNFLDTLTDE
jgi:BlaI family transcriptional regulator, penicillinase repressor